MLNHTVDTTHTGSDHPSIGQSVPRRDALDKLRGAACFSADLGREHHPLILQVLRSDRPHAEIKHIHTEAAQALDGVVRIFTAADIPGRNLAGIINKDQPLLAEHKVHSVGEPVALIAAHCAAAAESAREAIEVVYHDLPVLRTPQEALAPHAPAIHPKGNLLLRRCVQKGDVAAAWNACEVVVERTYQTSRVEHTCLEPDAGFGFVDTDGALVIYASTQNPHYDHKEVVAFLGLPDAQVRIIQAVTGGGFGSKLDLNMQGFIGLALYHLKCPVRMVYTREEVFQATAKRHPLTIHIKSGADREGRLLALEARIVCDTGAFGSYGIAVASRAAVHIAGPYMVPNVDVESLCVYTNNPFSGAMRGFGAPQAAFAHESQMDLLAEALKIDPLEIRQRNILRPGAATATGQVLEHSVGIGACLEAVTPHYDALRASLKTMPTGPTQRRGIGLGAMWYGIGNTGVQNPSTARVALDLDGRITLYTGCADIGQGSSTILSQIVAAILGLAPADIHLVVADTRLTTNAGATSASRQTYISGNAVYEATSKLADVLITEAVDRLKRPRTQLQLAGGAVVARAAPDHRIGLADLARRLQRRGLPLEWTGYFDPLTLPLDPVTGQGSPYATYAFAVHLAVLVADTLTGEVFVEKVVAAHDVGRAIHPANVRGQICGGVAMGLGFALMEEYDPETTLSLKDYHIPTIADIPQIVPLIIESPEPSGPFGAKGVGEPALIPTAPAILNALANALGARIHHLPANLERVLQASVKGGFWKK